jgi:hypothetical protein
MRSVVAKLWFEPASDTLAAAQRLRSRSHFKAGSRALCGFSQRLPFPASARTAPQPMLKGAVRAFEFPLSSRAPPLRFVGHNGHDGLDGSKRPRLSLALC